MRPFRFLLFIIFQLFFINLFGQDLKEEFLKVGKYNMENPQEKMYLHLDKFSYTAGENIWFKAYSTLGIQNLLNNRSAVAYVELIDASQKIISNITIPLVMGLGIGDFQLTDTITEGSYRLRAYTNWMRNAGPEYFYDRTIQISNGRSDNVLTSTSVTSSDKDNIYEISLKNMNGVSLIKTKVLYEVFENGKAVERKRVTTDNTGKIAVPLDKKYKNAQLSLHFQNDEDKQVNKLMKIISSEDKNDIQLFAEGGKIIANQINGIAVKSINNKGLGVKSKVFFLNGRDTLGIISTNDLGMGATTFFIPKGSKISAKAKCEDGSILDLAFPEIHESGYGLVVNNLNEGKLYAQLNISNDLVNTKDVYFVLHHLGEVFYVSKQKANKQELVFSSDKKILPNGVITITILDEIFRPLAERPIFNFSKDNLLSSTITLNQSHYKTREKVAVRLNIGKADDSVRIAAFSASVLDLSRIKDDYNQAPTILSSLFLSHDIKGYIERPGYYFENENVKLRDLDYLMLTQGWRVLDWDVIGLNFKPKFNVEKGLKIDGYAKKLGRTKPEPGANMRLISTRDYMDFIDTTASDDGYFVFDELLFPDSIKFLITAKDAFKGKNNIDIILGERDRAKVEINKNLADEIWDVNGFYIDDIKNTKEYFSELERIGLKDKAISIEEVVVTSKQRRKRAAENSSNLNGAGNANQVLTADDFESCISLEMCLQGRLTGVIFQGGVPINMRSQGPMQIVLDGMYVENDILSMINVADVESVEVLRSINYTSIYGSNGSNGLIIITSKVGKSAYDSYKPKGILTLTPQGFHVNREFYKPKYNVDEMNTLSRDLRTTIHWEPNLITDKEGNASFDFYTSDSKGKYLLILEGLDLEGRISRNVLDIIVN